jgi:hypothetical protein
MSRYNVDPITGLEDERLGLANLYNRKGFSRCRIVKKSRKDYTCEACGKKIPKGGACYYMSVSDGWRLGYYRIHIECEG